METNTPSPAPAGHQNFLKQVEEFFNLYLHKKAPFHFPPNAKEWIVKYSPWITLVLMILALPAILLLFSINALVAPTVMMYAGARAGLGFTIHGIIALAALVMEAVALPGLFSRSLKGWYWVYYAVLLGAVGQLLAGDIIGMIINLVISLYILFEIKEYYK